MTDIALPPPLDPDVIIGPESEDTAEPQFFGESQRTERWFLPKSKKQYVEFRIMNEGDRKKWQRKTSRDFNVNRRTQEARIAVDPVADREALFEAVIVSVNVFGPDGQPINFGTNFSRGSVFAQWLDRQDPEISDKLEVTIREAHPWMQDDMKPEDIREEITRLEKLLEVAEKRELEKATFSR